MGWEKSASPEVLAARDFAKKFDRDQVIILSIDRVLSIDREMRIHTVSYGASKYLCNVAKYHGDIVQKALIEHYEKGEKKNG